MRSKLNGVILSFGYLDFGGCLLCSYNFTEKLPKLINSTDQKMASWLLSHLVFLQWELLVLGIVRILADLAPVPRDDLLLNILLLEVNIKSGDIS